MQSQNLKNEKFFYKHKGSTNMVGLRLFNMYGIRKEKVHQIMQQ